MKIERITLSEFRRFRAPLVLADLQPGLNVFVGPNEAGKSTVVAAIRAAFLERSKTTKVADLASWGIANARPTVEIDFLAGGSRYQLRKSFLHRPRCELLIGGERRLEGEAAEDMLAQLLGFDFPAKGQSRPEHAGLPGLLWIQQGASHALHESAGHAAQHLREALTRLSGELTTADGDRLYERVAAEHGELSDARGKPRGRLREAAESLVQAVADNARLSAAVQALDNDVDRLARLRAEYARAQSEQAWIGFERQAGEARERLAAASKEREQVERLQSEVQQYEDTIALLREQVRRDQQDMDSLEVARTQSEAAEQDARALGEKVARARGLLQACERADVLARSQEQSARTLAERRDLDDDIARRTVELAQLNARLAQAGHWSAQADLLRADLAGYTATPQDLAALRELEHELSVKRARQSAVAARVCYILKPGSTIRLNGAPVTGSAELAVTATLVLLIDGVGEIVIQPGEGDLAMLAGQIDGLVAQRSRLLERLAAASLQEAEIRAAHADKLARELELAQGTLRVQAPGGIQALQGDAAELQARLHQARARRAAQAGDPDSAPIDPVLARDQAASAAAALAHARQDAAESVARRDAAQSRAQLLTRQVLSAQSLLASTDSVRARAARSARLVEMRGQSDESTRRLQASQTSLQAHQPELAGQDAQRYEQSAAISRRAQDERHAQLLQLQGKLEQAGAQGLGESLLAAVARLERVTRQHDELAQRAHALDLLFTLLAESRERATQRLQAPLSRQLNHYLGLVFPQASLQLDESLMPVSLARDGEHDPMRQLSFGTQEQLGVLVRLAYADLLRAAGRPTLIVLDDALVHTDDDRRSLMKRALYDVAGRHQILMFTCHGASWHDLGVPLRNLG